MIKETENKNSEDKSSQIQEPHKSDPNSKPVDYYYPENHREKTINDSDLPAKLVPFRNIIGKDASRRYNMYFLNSEEIITANGNTFEIININTKKRKIFQGTESGGVGCVTVHPEQKYFAVGECGEWPNIYIFEYDKNELIMEKGESSIKLYRILRKGTEKSYAALNFNASGDKLASVGGDPDYNLLIWNWMNESIILKAKAFSQEIYNVQFSLNFEGKLISSGIGHIKFWEMAKTFTGLKLQGELGKFGQIDLSDISAFLEFPDGKVLSGTESGTLLLWEGIFIKANIVVSEEFKCHQGLIEYMAWENNNEYIVTGGHDGYLRWWSFEEIDNVVIDDNYLGYVIPIKETLLVNPVTKAAVKIINLIKEDKFCLVQDGNGFLLKIHDLRSEEIIIENIYDFHAGAVIRLSLLGPSPYLITQGADATTSLININTISQNFTEKIVLENQSAELEATSCDFASREAGEDSVVLAVGYSIGLLRIYQLDTTNMKLELVNQIRAHEEAIQHILISPDKAYLLTATRKEIFMFLVDEIDRIMPHCSFKRADLERIVDIDWHPDSDRILVGLNTGTVEEIEIPKTFDSSKSYLMTNYMHKKFTVKLAEEQLEKEDVNKNGRKKENKMKEEPGPSPILSCKYAKLEQEGDFIVTANKPYNDSLYLCNFDVSFSNPKLRPINFWKLPLKPSVREFYIKHISPSFFYISDNRGAVQIRHKKMIDKYVEIFPNLYAASIKDIVTSPDERTLSVSYKDGTTFIYNINLDGINAYLDHLKLPNEDPKRDEFFKSFSLDDIVLPQYNETESENYLKEIKKNSYQVESNRLKKRREELEASISLEKEKKDEQEKEKLKQAEEKKNKSRARIQRLRDEFENIVSANNEMHEEIRMTSDELVVDEQYLTIIRKERDDNLSDIKHKYNWLKANVDFTIDKITFFFLNSVKTPKIYVYGLNSHHYVTTMRCPNLPSNFGDEILTMNQDINDFEYKIDFKSLKERYEKYLTDNDSNKDKEDNYVRSMTEQIKLRLDEYAFAEKENQHSGKRADSNKATIKEELKFTGGDLKQLKNILEDKKLNKNEALKRYLDHREKGKKSKHNQKHSLVCSKPERCPDSYYLKINYDFYYQEENMKTVLLHKKKMFDFLKVLFDDRVEFNKQVLELRANKVALIKTLQEKKAKLVQINDQLGVDPEKEKLDWLDFQMKDLFEFPEKEFIPKEEELEKYLHEKVVEEKELSNIFNIYSQNASNISTSSVNISAGADSIREQESTFQFLFNVKERRRIPNETNVESELRSINQIKLEHKKKKLITECQNMIEEFDAKVTKLSKLKTVTAFKQKLGELELLIKHEEFSILKAFETDDNILIRKLEDLHIDYEENIKNLHGCHDEIEQKEEELRKSKEDRKAKETEFYSLIVNEKDSREQLIKCFNQKRKMDLGSNIPDDKIDNEEELDLPRNISNQLKQDILALRDSRMHFDETIEKLTSSINIKKKDKDNLIQAKKNLDRRLEEVRDKINANERKKARYLNLIDVSIPLKLDQFCKLEVGSSENEHRLEIHRLQIDISKGILISKSKLIELKNLLCEIKKENTELEKNNTEFDNKYDFKEREKKDLEKQLKDLETNFQNEQILKFGLVIDFDHLLKASENTIIDKLEHEYKVIKREADNQIDEYKNKIDELKLELKNELSENTVLLNNIKEGLEKNQILDKRLNEKNNEIDKKSEKKFVMFNIQEKKDKLKEILKLLQQQMEALKKEIDIFRRKGGHIYSTIASNLN